MIRIVKKIRVWDVDDQTSAVDLPLFPATAVFSSEVKDSDNGKYEDTAISSRLKWDVDRQILHRDLIMEVTFDNGDVRTVGTEAMPVRLVVTETEYVAFSAQYARRI